MQFRRIATVFLLGVLGGGCKPIPVSAPHALLDRAIPWPAMRRGCAAQDKTCTSRSDVGFGRDARPSLVEFWSPNCSPCRERLIELQRRHEQFDALGWSIELVAVLESDESASLAMERLRSWGIFETSWILSESEATNLGIHGLPSLWLVAAQRRLRWVAPARASLDDVLAAAQRMQ